MSHEKINIGAQISWILPPAVLSFLFIGFLKGLFYSPIDLTIATGILLCMAILPSFRDLSYVCNPTSAILLCLVCWCGISAATVPIQPEWGVHKVLEAAAFGIPAFVAGFIIARHRGMQRVFMKLTVWTGAVVSLAMILQAATGNPYSFSYLGSGGYQLTGTYLALAFLFAGIRRMPALFAINFLGCSVTGHISGAVFGLIVLIIIWLVRKDWRSVRDSSLCSGALIVAYTILVAPPLIVMRCLWKFGGAILIFLNQPVTPELAASTLKQSPIGEKLNTILKAMPEESQKYLVDYSSGDRADLYKSAWDTFVQHPWLGSGFGNVQYGGLTYPHNIILEIAAETGIIGFSMLAALILISIYNIGQSRNSFIVGVFSVIFLTFMFSGYFGGRLLFFAFGLASAAAGSGSIPLRYGASYGATLRWVFSGSLPSEIQEWAFWRRVVVFASASALSWFSLELTRMHLSINQETRIVWEDRGIVAGSDHEKSVSNIDEFAARFGYKQIRPHSDNGPIQKQTFTYTYRDEPAYGIIIAWMKSEAELDLFFSRLSAFEGVTLYSGPQRHTVITPAYPWSKVASIMMAIIIGAFACITPSIWAVARSRDFIKRALRTS